ncbi:hypothetical protein GCM10025868_15440 [Angustibacter aerolatus]|uniref:Uncharacterized protein n=1 Tax=Angustibacter aerolatus TaxID=1162965 RepID=A0ABQ6JEQ6_9ACTN|nr:hypothetical protein GCM10025868_15440 [Angustibacter aerolatus]
MAGRALDGAVEPIAQSGGGVVEAYPQVTSEERLTASHLYSVTRSLFEQHGFTYLRRKGTKHCVVRRVVAPAAGGPVG